MRKASPSPRLVCYTRARGRAVHRRHTGREPLVHAAIHRARPASAEAGNGGMLGSPHSSPLSCWTAKDRASGDRVRSRARSGKHDPKVLDREPGRVEDRDVSV
jgi:hypothetical protein